MLYAKIEEILAQSKFMQRVLKLPLKDRSIQIYHLNQSARALLAVHLWKHTGKNIILVSQDDIIAEDIWDDLCVLIGKENAHYLPDYEILPYEERSPHYSIRATRMETFLATLNNNKSAIYSLSARALGRYLPAKKFLSRHILHLKQGMECEPDTLLHNLYDMGYEIQYQVSKVFQAAKRGGIIDIFSPPLTNPVRLEFWGDEIIGMRVFSVTTQRSLEQYLTELTILPARELSLSDVDSGSPIIAKIRNQGFFEGIENYYALLCNELQTFADYFEKDNRILVWNNFYYLQEEYETLFEQALTTWQKEAKIQGQGRVPRPEQMFADWDVLTELKEKSEKFIFLKVNLNSPSPL